MNISKAGVGMYASAIFVILQLAGIDVDEGQVTEVVLAGATIVTFIMWIWGQIDRKDLTLGIFRK